MDLSIMRCCHLERTDLSILGEYTEGLRNWLPQEGSENNIYKKTVTFVPCDKIALTFLFFKVRRSYFQGNFIGF